MKVNKSITAILKFGTVGIVSLALIITIAGYTLSSSSYSSGDFKMNKVVNSTQYNDGKFVNIKPAPEMSFLKMAPVMWDFLTVKNDRKPNVEIPSEKIDFTMITNAEENELRITWVGHSSQIINIDGKILLTDPVFENKTLFMGPSRFNGPVPLEVEDLPEIDLVLISHNHYDHLNQTTITKIHPKVKKFIVPLLVGAELEKMEVPREKIIEMDWWEEITLFENLLIAFTPAQHFSGRGLFDKDNSLWGSYVVQGTHYKIYFSGDSGYFEGFKEIGEKYGPFDYTFIECGAYNEKWHYVHMFPEETVKAHIDLKGKVLQPIHWGTFDLALHSWYDPMVRVANAADRMGVKLSTPIVGETLIYDENLKTKRWWENLIKNKNFKLTVNK